MIDEQATFEEYGYYSTDLKPQSNKKIVAVCDVCGKIRYVIKYSYSDLCTICVRRTDKYRRKTGDIHRGKIISDETRANISIGSIGRKMPPVSDEHRQHLSAAGQGIPYEEWEGFAKNGAYCEKFDDACRERIRAKYNHRCYICDKPQEDNANKNGKARKLDVHHVDQNRNQGCDGVQWKLVPLCMHCHGKSHHEPMKSRIDYLVRAE